MPGPYRHEIIAADNGTLARFILHADNASQVAPHWHKSLELSYTLSGTISGFTINGKTYATRAGQILVVNPNEVHAVVSQSQGTTEALTVLFPRQLLLTIIPELDTLSFDIPDAAAFTRLQRKAYRRLQHLLHQAASLTRCGEQDVGHNLLLNALAYQLLYWLLRAFAQQQNRYRYRNINPTEKMSRITEWIDSHYHEKIAMADVARRFYLSETWLAHSFRQSVGRTFHEYLVSVRLNAAMVLLFDSNLQVQTIAERCGFPNFKSFAYYFKQAHGMTPLQYRKSRR
ncbi:TPA: helix-turn-helix domain-containing protein [Kluyvera georgiana]|uniref:AraC family transcriptional regulator n=1 Tax=Kluyvera georgiana ATCC 51603 TaxID=1354264 RepID=A0A1B7K8G5_9ENTR|nr:AraC family transcriptional regulator [Kluyvera georgiana]OAT56403.1 AraC family transcriptional regulator [Kluyvera georgiana ATCC 51603]